MRNRRRAQREAIWVKHQMDPSFSGEEEDTEIVSAICGQWWILLHPHRCRSPESSAETQYGVVLDMVRQLNSEMDLITLDYDKIRTVCEKLLDDNKDRDHAMSDLTGLVKRSLDRPLERLPQPDAFKPDTFKPRPIIRPDLIDNDGYFRATDIGITWAGSDTLLHGVKVVGSDVAGQPARPQPPTSTPCQPVRDHGGCDMSTPRQPPPMLPTYLEIPETCTPLRRNTQECRHDYRLAPIQWFNNKSLNRFDPASRVMASRSRFHGRLQRHHEDADSFGDAITDLVMSATHNYEMRPIARRMDNTRPLPGSPRAPFTPGQGCHTPIRSGHDFSGIKRFSCGQLGHTQARCPKPDSTLPLSMVVSNSGRR